MKLKMKKMKKTSLLALFFAFTAAMVLTSSCEKVKDLTSFNVKIEAPEHRFTLDSAAMPLKSTATETLFTYQMVNVNIDSILQSNGISSATISNGGLTDVVLAIVLPVGTTFDWLSSARAVASLTLEGLATGTQIAHTATLAPGSTSVNLVLDNAAITQFINNNNFYIGVYGTLLGPLPSTTVTCTLNSSFTFTVNPLGE